MDKQVYLLVLGRKLAGSQIRSLRIFRELHKRFDKIFLVFHKGFLEKVLDFKEFEDYNIFKDNIIEIEPYSAYEGKSFNYLYKNLKKHIAKSGIIHFNQNFPASYKGRVLHKSVYTFNENSTNRFNWLNCIFFYLTILRSNSVDILDPLIYKRIQNIFPSKKRLYLTKAGSLNPSDYKFDLEEKKNNILFSGRFNEQKQVLKFVNAIEYIYIRLASKGIIDVKFYLIGFGPLENEVLVKISELSKKDIEVYAGYKANFKHLLEESKVFLSIQKYNNYPSNSLMEAMAAACIPVVTDNGSTRLLAKEEFSYYVPEDFNSEEISIEISKILLLRKDLYKTKALKAREIIEKEFNIGLAADYYAKLYEEL